MKKANYDILYKDKETGLNNVCACAKIKSNFRANARERDVWFFHVQLNDDNWQETKIFHYFGT